MKHFKLFFALFAMLALGVGNAWGAGTWTLVKDASTLAAGDKVIIVAKNSNFAMSTTQNTNNRGQVEVTKNGETLTYATSVQELTLEAGKKSGTFAFYTGNGYLYAASSSKNYLKTETKLSDNSSWNITIANTGVATIKAAGTNTRNCLRYNNSNKPPIFSCYGSGQADVCLYKYIEEQSGGDEPVDIIVKTLKSIAVEGATSDYVAGDIFKFDGTCTATYAVTKNDVPQEDETKEVTPTSVSTPDMSTAGEKEVTVTYTEDDVTVTAIYTITVAENVITAGEYELALNNTFFGTTAGANVSAFPTSAKQDDITVTLNGGGTKTRTDADCVRMYQNNTLTFSVPAGYVINSIVFTAGGDWKGSISVNAGTYTDGTKSWAGSAQEVVFSFGAQNRIATATVTYAAAGETPEVPIIDAPTFSLEAGTYDEEQEVTLSAEEGTIYYTLDGTTPTAESEEYTAPIVLDECGEITIKAIAISGETTSSVASATYTIKLPIEAVSAEDPYTEAEAIEVYDGGCYDNQYVYVMGVVKTAQFYNSNTYTITLEGGFQFYKFYEATGDTQFTEDYIVAGDTLVACGKLDNYKGTYQLAAGCYLVERKAYSVPKVDISNTPETAYTVAEAIALIDDITSDLTKQVYVKGTVSEIVTEYNVDYGNITYNISSDGSTSSPQFQLFRGKSYDGEKFTSADDIKVGDKVVVYGEMTKYGSTYEMLANNQLVALERENTTTALDNVEATVTPVKAIVNGQLVIIKNGVQYNATGAVVK